MNALRRGSGRALRRGAGRTGRVAPGEPLTILLIAVSILGGIALAIACSYRPIALWWVMIAGSAFNVFRVVARLSRQSRGDRPAASYSPLVTLITRGLARPVAAPTRAKAGTSKG